MIDYNRFIGLMVLFLFRLNTLNNTLSLFNSGIFCKYLYP